MSQKIFCIKNKKGSMLAFALVILATMLVIAASSMSIGVDQKKEANSTQFSVQAYQLADSAAQSALQKINNAITNNNPANPTVGNVFSSCNISNLTDLGVGSYDLGFLKSDGVTPVACTDLVADIARIKAVGKYRDTVRAVSISVGASYATPIAWLKFDEVAGLVANNTGSLGALLNGTLRNGVLWTTSGRPTGVAFLDGLNDYIEVPDNVALKYSGGTAGLTVSLWVKPDATDDGGDIISKPWNGGGQYNYRISSSGGASPGFILSFNGVDYISFNQTISAGTWHLLSFTIDGNDKSMKLYIDGSLTNNGTSSITNWAPSSGDSNVPLSIGTLYPYGQGWVGNSGFSFKGFIDDVKIFNYALSASNVQTEYNNGK